MAMGIDSTGFRTAPVLQITDENGPSRASQIFVRALASNPSVAQRFLQNIFVRQNSDTSKAGALR
jgi:hypothetical protein